MSDSKVLITRPHYDDTTSYLSEWSKKIIKVASEKGLDLIDLHRDRANKKELESVIEDVQPKFIIFNGHGSDREIAGQDNETLIRTGENEHLLKSKIIYARACESVKTLGHSCVNLDTLAYVGYEESFVFIVNKNKAATPLLDEFAKPFFETSNVVPISIIKGNTVNQAFLKSQEAFKKKIDYFRAHYSLESSHIMFFLRWDMLIQKALGDLSVSI